MAVNTIGAGVILNEGSIDVDFRVESNGNANMLFVDGGNDRVGIGEASPTDPLHVKTTAVETRISLESSTGKWAIGAEDNDKFGILNYGTSTPFIIDSTGKIGIGTVSPAYRFDVLHDSHSGTIAQFGGDSGDGNSTDIRIRNTHQASSSTNETTRLIFELGSTNAGIIEGFKEADGTSAGNRTGGLAFYTSNANSVTEKMRIDSGGVIQLEDGMIVTKNDGSSTNAYMSIGHDADYGQIGAGESGIWGVNNNDIIFGTNDNLRMTIEADGTLQIPGTATFSGNTTFAEYLKHDGDSDTYFRFSAANNIEITAGKNQLMRFEGNAPEVVINEAQTDIDFRVESDAHAHCFFVRGSDGKVGVQTSNPASTFEVNGDLMASTVATHSATASASGTATVTVGDGGMGIWAAQFGNGNNSQYKCGFWWSMNGNSSVQVHTSDTGTNGVSTNADITMSADDDSISAAFGSLSGATGALKVMSLGFN